MVHCSLCLNHFKIKKICTYVTSSLTVRNEHLRNKGSKFYDVSKHITLIPFQTLNFWDLFYIHNMLVNENDKI